MQKDQIISILEAGNFHIANENNLKNGTGIQLHLDMGAIVNCFHKGTYNVQGKNSSAVDSYLKLHLKEIESIPNKKSHLENPTIHNKVFVVYGHDKDSLNELEAMLRRWKLEPLILDQLPSEGQTLIEKLEKYTAEVKFAVVLATPDDKGYRNGHEDELASRARQNVVLELGMLLTRLGRKNVAILLKQQEKMERPSDIQGLIYLPFHDKLQKEVGPNLAKEMLACGYEISLADL